MPLYPYLQELVTILKGPMPMGHLDRAVLEVASFEHPGLTPEPYLQMLDEMAATLAGRVACDAPADEFIAAANHLLFTELGFAGDNDTYYDPCNSCLNEVLRRRRGIPITLAVIYMEVARRLARPVYGIGLPGHFIVQYDDGNVSRWIDPFHGGELLTPDQCLDLARRAAGGGIEAHPSLLQPVTHRQILQRMINNLRTSYLSRRCFRKALGLLDFLLELFPDSAEEYKQRGVVHASLRHASLACCDLQRYLCLSPAATDRAEIEKQLLTLRQYLAGLN